MQYPKLYAMTSHDPCDRAWNCDAIAVYVDIIIDSSALAIRTPSDAISLESQRISGFEGIPRNPQYTISRPGRFSPPVSSSFASVSGGEGNSGDSSEATIAPGVYKLGKGCSKIEVEVGEIES
jgi:hypothetical protein